MEGPVKPGQGKWLGLGLLLILSLTCAGLGTCAVFTGATFDPKESGAPIREMAVLIGIAEMVASATIVFLAIRWWKK